MTLSHNNVVRIIDYLKSTDAFAPMSRKEIAEHLDALISLGQFDAEEDRSGELVYACAWWMCTDKVLADVKKNLTPKYFDRGRNLVGLFLMNGSLSIGGLKSMIRRNITASKAKTFSVYTPRHKWVSVSTEDFNWGDDMRERGPHKKEYPPMLGGMV